MCDFEAGMGRLEKNLQKNGRKCLGIENFSYLCGFNSEVAGRQGCRVVSSLLI